MSELPDFKNEPTIDLSRDNLDEFSQRYRLPPEQRVSHDHEPPKSRYRYVPALVATLVAIVGGWHWFAANHLEQKIERHLNDLVRDEIAGVSVAVDVHPLTNLVDIQVTRPVRGRESASEFFEDAMFEYIGQQVEPMIERELSGVARRDTDLYAMMVPYQVAVTMDKVRLPPSPPPSRLVQEIQRQLSARGYKPGGADGRLGLRTRNAIEEFQRDHGLTVDGRASGGLLEKLRKE